MHDAKRDLLAMYPAERCKNEFGISELLYADDTLLVGTDQQILSKFVRSIEDTV